MLLIAHVAEVGESFVAELGEREGVFPEILASCFPAGSRIYEHLRRDRPRVQSESSYYFCFAICFLNGFTLSIVITFST